MKSFPIQEEQHKKLEEILRKISDDIGGQFNSQVEQTTKFLKEELSWGQFNLLVESIERSFKDSDGPDN